MLVFFCCKIPVIFGLLMYEILTDFRIWISQTPWYQWPRPEVQHCGTGRSLESAAHTSSRKQSCVPTRSEANVVQM